MHIDERTEIARHAQAKASRFLVHQRQWEHSVIAAVGAALTCAKRAILDQGGQLNEFQEELSSIQKQLAIQCLS